MNLFVRKENALSQFSNTFPQESLLCHLSGSPTGWGRYQTRLLVFFVLFSAFSAYSLYTPVLTLYTPGMYVRRGKSQFRQLGL